MGKKKVNLKENPKILAKRQRMAAHIKEVDSSRRRLKLGAFLRKYGRVLIGGSIILAVLFCAIFAGLLTEWDPEKTNIPEAKMKIATIADSDYGFVADIARDGVKVSFGKADKRVYLCQLYTADGSTVVETPVVGENYKLGIAKKNQPELPVVYLTGAMRGKTMHTTQNVAEAATFGLEETKGGYYLYTDVNGSKTYFNAVTNEVKRTVLNEKTGREEEKYTVKPSRVKTSLESTAKTVFEWDSKNSSVVTTLMIKQPAVGELEYWFGADPEKSKTDISLSQSATNTLLCQFYTADGSAVAEEIVEDTAYTMGMINPNVDESTVYYLTGNKTGNKLSTTDDVQKADKFYLEKSENGYYLYNLKNGAKNYINLVVQANRTKLQMGTYPITEFALSATNKTVSTKIYKTHAFGTDIYGRDVWSRLIFGSRNTLAVSFGAQVILMISGTLLGLLCGYYTKVEKYLMRVLEAIGEIPSLLMTLLMVSVFGSGVFNMMLAMSFGGIPGLTRMIRNQVLSLREKEYIESEKAMGAGDLRTMLLHILPACSSYLLVRFSGGLSSAILSMTSLSYLGVGLDPTIASWGGMIANSQKVMFALPHSFMVPTFAIAITVFGFAMLGDGLRDLLDPKLR